MADPDYTGFAFDPNALRQPYAPRFSWPNPNAQLSTPQRANLRTSAHAVKRNPTPLLNHPGDVQSSYQDVPFGPPTQSEDHAFARSRNQQNPQPVPVQQAPGQFAFDQHQPQHQHQHLPPSSSAAASAVGGGGAAAQQSNAFQPQSHFHNTTAPSYHPPMNPTANLSANDQSTPDWSYEAQQTSTSPEFPLNSAYATQIPHQPFLPYDPSPVSMFAEQTGQFNTTLNTMDNAYFALNNDVEGISFNWQDFSHQLGYGSSNSSQNMPEMTAPNFPNSPTDTSLEVRSLSSSDNGWIECARATMPEGQSISNPGETLHGRTFSDSSYSDVDRQARSSWSSYVEISPHAIGSPSSDGLGGFDHHYHEMNDFGEEIHIKREKQRTPPISTSTTPPIRIKTTKSPQRSPIRRQSPPARRQPRKNSIKSTAQAKTKRQGSIVKTETEKRIGRRKGPLSKEQRQQASEIRKLGACLRCRFLKKNCDKGDPCEGCRPSHARLWQVPCTRIDIKDIAFFMKDWKADVDRDVVLHFSVDNILDFSPVERQLYISHGYGHYMPVTGREVYVRDEECFGVDWVETFHDQPIEYSVHTARMSPGVAGITQEMINRYLDLYIDDGYEDFIDQYFEGTPFITEMLKTVHRYYVREPTSVLRKTLKFLLAYNLTQHVTYAEGIPAEEGFEGKINDTTSKFSGKIVAPVMINFSVKIAMAKMWRELQKEILEELSVMYSSYYSKEKLRNWPTIFMVACILLAVWEEMQFDCHYRVRDTEEVNKFCSEMESIPVKVVVGLFHAISQKLPALQDWETRKHHPSLNSNAAICDALTEVRQHVTQHDQYLRSRCNTQFDSRDFDSLSSKFMSKLVIRPTAA